MISTGFTVIGLWIVILAISFLIIGLFAIIMHDTESDETILIVSLAIFIAIFELVFSVLYVTFKTTPEELGYTRIERELIEEND